MRTESKSLEWKNWRLLQCVKCGTLRVIPEVPGRDEKLHFTWLGCKGDWKYLRAVPCSHACPSPTVAHPLPRPRHSAWQQAGVVLRFVTFARARTESRGLLNPWTLLKPKSAPRENERGRGCVLGGRGENRLKRGVSQSAQATRLKRS